MESAHHSQSARTLIIGAAGGIGSVLARQLAQKEYQLVLAGRHLDKLTPLAEELGARALEVDVTSSSQTEACLAAAIESMAGLDAVALCVGSIILKPAHLTSDEEWNETLSLNLTSAFNVTRAAGRHMGKSGGSVVFVSTAAAHRGLPNHEAIAASKAGIEGLARSAAATYANRGLRFNVVAPGLIDTPLSQKIVRHKPSLDYSSSLHALGRIGQPEEVASAIAWFMDPQQSWVTGQVLGVDGGLSNIQPR